MAVNNRLQQLMEFLKETPNDAFTLYAVALEHLAAGDKKNAQHYLEQTLLTNANYVAAYYQLGKLMEELDAEKSRQLYTDGIAKAMQQRKLHDASELRQALAMINGDEDDY